MTSHPRRITRALLSVSDKAGLIDFAKALAGYGVELVSTGGTAKALKDAGLKVIDVAELTGFPEMMDGRVKTLHPKVHGGLLAIRANKEHAAAMDKHGIKPIDLLVVNLYPFEATVAKGAAFDDCIENIDIGGPAMIRAAAKNHADVTVVVEPADYEKVLAELALHGGMTSLELRQTSGGEGLCAHRGLRRGDLQLVRRRAARQRTRLPRLRRQVDPVACVTARTRIRARRSIVRRASVSALLPRGSCRARNCPTTTSTTPTRPMSALPSSTPSAPRPASSSSTPIRAAWRKAAVSSTPTRKRSPAIPPRPSAASSRSTASSTPTRPRRSPRSSPR